jgi:ankyrin repeat protein
MRRVGRLRRRFPAVAQLEFESRESVTSRACSSDGARLRRDAVFEGRRRRLRTGPSRGETGQMPFIDHRGLIALLAGMAIAAAAPPAFAGPGLDSCRVVSMAGVGPQPESGRAGAGVAAVRPLLDGARSGAKTTVTKVVHRAPSGLSGGLPGALPPPKDAREAVIQTVRRRDLPAFLQALPADAEARDQLLATSFALDASLREAALPILRQILAWHPDALRERFANSNTIGLEAVTNQWLSVHDFTEQEVAVEHAPAPGDYVEIIRLLLRAGARPDGFNDWRPPLAAVANLPPSPQTLEAARLLLGAGARIDAPRTGAVAPLVAAAQSANGEMVALLLATGHADPATLETALVKSPIVGSNSALPMLLAAGADINTQQPPGADPRIPFTPAQAASRRYRFEGERELMQLMIRYRADPNRIFRPGVLESPLMNVVADPELVEGLLALGADPNYRNLAGDTPLLLAVRLSADAASDASRERTIAQLLERGADPRLANQAGSTPLRETRGNDDTVIEWLLARGGTWQASDADLVFFHNQQAPAGAYAWALFNRKDALASASLAHGRAPGPEDCGIVYYAAESGATRTLTLLLDRHLGNPQVRDNRGFTTLMAASANGQLDSIRLLLARGVADVNTRLDCSVALQGGGHAPPFPAVVGGQTALMLAAQARQTQAVRELILRGADVNAKDCRGNSVLFYAESGGVNPDSEAARVLRENGARP